MKKLVLLDLDNTLIHTTNSKDENYNYSFIINNYTYNGYFRPNLKEFLSFLFENYNVGIFTASTELYANNILKSFLSSGIINNIQYDKLVTILLCRNDLVEYKLSSCSYITIKSLEIASKKHNIPIDNILLIDDWNDIDNPYTNQIYSKNIYWEYESYTDYLSTKSYDSDFNKEYHKDNGLLNVIEYLKTNF